MGSINSSNPIRNIDAYKSIAESNLHDLQSKPSKSKEDDAVIRVLNQEIKNLESQKTLIQTANKVDTLFRNAIKLIFGEKLGNLILRVTVGIPEERIQHIANRILNVISNPELKALAALQSYQGEILETNRDKWDVRELLSGIGVDTAPTDYPHVPVKVPQQFMKDITRTPYLKVGDQEILQGSPANAFKEIPDRYQSLMQNIYQQIDTMVGKEALSPFLNLCNQSVMAGAMINLSNDILPKLQEKMSPDVLLVLQFPNSCAQHELGLESAPKAGSTINIYADRSNNIHLIYTDSQLITNAYNNQMIGFIGFSREVIISKKDLANVKDQDPDPNLTPSLQVIDRFSPVYSMADGILAARAKAFEELDRKRQEAPPKENVSAKSTSYDDDDYFDWTTDEFWQNR